MYPIRANRHRQLFFLIGSLLLSNASFLYALPKDSQEPIYVRADSADIQQNRHHGIYTGHVAVDQGSTHIRAGKAVTDGDEHNQLISAMIEGDHNGQAHYWTLQSPDKPELHAYADTIYYYPKQRQIVLKGHAYVLQGENKITASLIRYDIETQHVSTAFEGEQTAISVQSADHNFIEPKV